jgi:hypothetical protein
VRRLRDFESIAAFLSDQEIDELQATIDARREARAEDPAPPSPEPKPRGRAPFLLPERSP